MTKICVICGKEFEPIFQREKTCSFKCKAEAARINRQFREPHKRGRSKDIFADKRSDRHVQTTATEN